MATSTFSGLPTVANALLADIFPADQANVTSQITFQQLLNLMSSGIIQSYPGNPNGNVAGTAFNFLWDTSSLTLWICTAAGSASTAVWTAVTNSPGINWVPVTGTSQTMAPDSGYICLNSSLTMLTMPPIAGFGTLLYVSGMGVGGWTIVFNSGQKANIGSNPTTVTTGSISSTNNFDSLVLVCAVANTTWCAVGGPQGNLTIV